jgi:hypothetical protein
MTLLAVSGLVALIPILFVLACPLMMIFMIRGGHGHGGGSNEHAVQPSRQQWTLEELKRERAALNEQIAERAEGASADHRRAVSP